ncbi:MAG: plastocyanin/azurin family copper-binding protein [Acidobacteriota bacterium]
MAYFPRSVTIHVGDTVHWVQNSNEIHTVTHTVTFLNGEEEPPLAVFEDGFLYLNSDVFFPAGGAVLTRSGTFNSGLLLPNSGTTYTLEMGDMKPGLQHFLCLRHDSSGMTGKLMILP